MCSSDPVGKIEGTIMMRLLIALILSLCLAACAGTTVRMAKRYGHIGHSARRDAVDKLATATVFDREGAQKWAQSHSADTRQVQ